MSCINSEGSSNRKAPVAEVQLGEFASRLTKSRPPRRGRGISMKRVALGLTIAAAVLAPLLAHGQIREYGPTAFRQFPAAANNFTTLSGGVYIPGTNVSELVRAVLPGTNGSGVIDKAYVLSDVYSKTSTSGTVEFRDYSLSKITISSGALTQSVGPVLYDFGSHTNLVEVDDVGALLYKTDGLDRLGGAVLDSGENYIYTVGRCNTASPTSHAQSFIVSRFNTSNLTEDTTQTNHRDVGSGLSWSSGEGNAIGIDTVRNRLFVAGAKIASGATTRDVVVAEFDLSQASWPMVGSPYVITRTGDDVVYYMSVHNVSSTSTKVFISGETDTTSNGQGLLTFGLTESNSGTWTENWRHTTPSETPGGVRNDGIAVSSNLSDLYLVATEGDLGDDYYTRVLHLNAAGSGTITAGWETSVGAEWNPGGVVVATENTPAGFSADSSGNFWLSYTAYRDTPNGNDIRVSAWTNSGSSLISNYYDSGSKPDIAMGGIFDPRSGTNKFYVVGATTTSTIGMHAGVSTSSALTYPTSQPSPNPNLWSAANSPWTGTSLPLTGLGMTAIKGASSGLTFNGLNSRTYNCAIFFVRPKQAGMDSWDVGTEDNSEIRKYRYHAFEVTLFGIN